jgi:hypothetical protein
MDNCHETGPVKPFAGKKEKENVLITGSEISEKGDFQARE